MLLPRPPLLTVVLLACHVLVAAAAAPAPSPVLEPPRALGASAPAVTLVLTAPPPADERLALVADLSWIYRRESGRDGSTSETERIEVITAYPLAAPGWVMAVRTLSAPLAPGASAPPARIQGRIPGGACLSDPLAQETLQAEPCIDAIVPGSRWTLRIPWSESRRQAFHALDWETLQVPAGRFRALRIEADELDERALPGGARATVRTQRTVYWAVPRLGGMARIERENLRPDGTVADRQVELLESAGPAGDEAKAAVRATAGWQAWDRRRVIHDRISAREAALVPLGQKAGIDASFPGCRPAYPAAAVRALAMGVTRLRLLVEADGHVSDSEVLHESGPTREHRLLDLAAQTALVQCPILAARDRSGAPTASVMSLEYVWRLD